MSKWLATKRGKALAIAIGGFAATSILYLWLPFRVAIVRLVFLLGGERLMVGKYGSLDLPDYVPVAGLQDYPDDAEVLGLDRAGEARAIPVKRIAWHLAVNDEIAGEPILVTLCTVSEAAMAYQARWGGRTLRFKAAGLSRNNLTLEDVETGSRWQQFTGEAISGPLAGAALQRIPLERTTLGDWRRRHPGGRALRPAGNAEDSTAPNDDCPVMCYFPTEPFLLQKPLHEDDRLPRKQRVFGAVLPQGEAAAWRLDAPGAQAAMSAEPVIWQVQCYWFAWAEFHPGARLADGSRRAARSAP